MDARDPVPDPAIELGRALELASGLLAERGEDRAAYRIVEALNRLRGDGGGPEVWRVTFKRRDLIPADGSEIGMGGEVQVDVDLGSGTARIGGFGE